MLSTRGNNNFMQDVSAPIGQPDVNKFLRDRERVLQNPEAVSQKERSRFVPLTTSKPLPPNATLLDIESLPVKSRRYKVEFTGTLTEFQKSGEDGVTWLVPEANARIFQDISATGTPVGDLSKVIPIAGSVSNVKSTLPFDTAAVIPGMQGEDIYMANGLQATVHIPAGAPGTDSTQIACHKLDPNQIRLTELRKSSVTEEKLNKEFSTVPDNPTDTATGVPMVLLSRHGEITRLLANAEVARRMGIDVESVDLTKNNDFFYVQADVVELCKNTILHLANNIKMPFINHFKWPITLIKEDGMPWSDVDCDPSIKGQSDVISEYLLAKTHSISFVLHYDYLIAGKDWQQSSTK